MPTCPKCGSPLEPFKGKLVCSRADCDGVLILSADSGAAAPPWHLRLCQQAELWHTEVFDDFPAIIAHEYWRLYDLLLQGQPYGAFLQLKDVFEVLIKFPTLAAASMIYSRPERSDNENKILIALLEKWLTLGTWEEIAKTMGKRLTLPPGLAMIQQDVVALFQQHDIREWRNRMIGHGALAFEADLEFQQDIEARLSMIGRHFRTCAAAYRRLTLSLVSGEQSIRLHGRERARNLSYPSGQVVLQVDGIDVALSPYILYKDQGLYFFDSYLPRDATTMILSYSEGDRQYIASRELTQLYSTLRKEGELQEFASALNDDTYSALEAETLKKIAEIDDFQKPIYLKKWLHDLTETHRRGVFLLQMERGMGKSTFCRALDHQSLSRIHLSDPDEFAVRSYYVNAAYLHKVEYFVSTVGFLFVTDTRGRVVMHGNLPTLSAQTQQKPDAFAALLNFYRREHQKHFGKRALLFILDGLDEIPATDGASLFDFLPAPELLDDGVYLLLTCRTDAELAHFTLDCINALACTARLNVPRNDVRHVDVLRAYITNHLTPSATSGIETVLRKADYRFLYLTTLKNLLAASNLTDPDLLADGRAVFSAFLTQLRQAYGDKFFNNAIRLLAIFATAFEPLTLQEVSFLFGEAQPTFRFLAYLTDIRGFLTAEHSYRGHLLSIAHPELREVLVATYQDVIHAQIQRWQQEFARDDLDQLDLTADGIMYLCAHLADYIAAYGRPEELERFDAAFLKTLSALAARLPNAALAEHQRERALALYTALADLQLRRLQAGQSDMRLAFAKTLLNRGRAYVNLRRLEEALADYQMVVVVYEQSLLRGELPDEDRIAAALLNRGSVYVQLQQLDEALADYTEAIAIRQKLLSHQCLRDECSLARAFVNRGNLYRRLHNETAALADLDQAVTIQRRCLATGALKRPQEFAATLMNRGILLAQQHSLKRAFEDYEEAIALYHALLQTGAFQDENELARVFLNRGVLYEQQHQFRAALADYSQVIEIQERLRHTGRLVDEQELARAYGNRGIVYTARHQTSEALHDFDRAAALYAHLEQENAPVASQDVAWIRWNRGAAYTQAQAYGAALADVNRALVIYRELQQTGSLDVFRELALTLVQRGIILIHRKKLKQARQDFEQALVLQTDQLQSGARKDENDLAWTFLQRGLAWHTQHKSQPALNDLNQAVDRYERLHAAGTLSDEHDLALALIQRGLARIAGFQPACSASKDAGDPTLKLTALGAAIDDWRRALKLLKPLLPERPILIALYAQTTYDLLAALRERGDMNGCEQTRREVLPVLESYELTDEARVWYARLQQEM